jgi:hypothetical protein
MAKFLKHVGKHGDRKVAIVFREIPGESHMCLVVYTQLLNQNIHDPLIQTIESDLGQTSENLADALNRSYTKDGQIILQVLHREGMLKKVQTSQILMTPAPNQQVKLDELNQILDEMAKGEEAVRKLAEIDASRGLQDPKDVARRMRGESTVNLPPQKKAPVAAQAGALGDSDIANNLRQQAARMDAEARGLMAEAHRMLKEAAQLEGAVPESAPVAEAPAKKTRAAKTTKSKTPVVEAMPVVVAPVAPAKKAGRPKKAAVAG